MAIYRDTMVFCLSITGTENFQYRPLLASVLPSATTVKMKYNSQLKIFLTVKDQATISL